LLNQKAGMSNIKMENRKETQLLKLWRSISATKNKRGHGSSFLEGIWCG
jgi:hypothetical protein